MARPIPESEAGNLRVEPATFGAAPVVTDAPSWLSLREPEVVPWLPDSVDDAPTVRQPMGAEGEDAAMSAGPDGAPTEEQPQLEVEDAVEPGPTADEHEAALSAAREEVAQSLSEPYEQAASHLREVAQRLEREVDEATVQMAVELASAILTREASADPAILRSTVRSALQEAGPVVDISLQVHPADLEQAREEAPAMAEQIAGRAVSLSVAASSDVERGTCVVQFDRGIVDTRWSTQLRHMADAARQALDGAREVEAPVSGPEEEGQ